MAQNYVKIPKDLSLIKQKFILGLTKRQAISFVFVILQSIFRQLVLHLEYVHFLRYSVGFLIKTVCTLSKLLN